MTFGTALQCAPEHKTTAMEFDPINDPDGALTVFRTIRESDLSDTELHAFAGSWQLLEDARRNGRLDHMEFETYIGVRHLTMMFDWIDHFDYGPVPGQVALAADIARGRKHDQQVAETLQIDVSGLNMDAIAYYNAQDHAFRTPPNRPARLTPHTILDFGAGHGRQANLLARRIADGDCTYIAVDATPACYLNQWTYFTASGFAVNDYLTAQNDWSITPQAGQVHHVPTWKMDLIGTGQVDEIICVQVLRELAKPMLGFALKQFARLLSPGGSLYIRDHIGFHNPSAVDLDQALMAHGFLPEWYPRWIDRKDVHGIPRIWRKPEVEAVLGAFL